MAQNNDNYNVFRVDKQMMTDWQPAMEQFFGVEQLANVSSSKKRLLTAIAAKAYESNPAQFTAANENVGFVQLTANNANHAPNVANPTAGGNNGLTSLKGNSGSGDPQFLIGLCLSLAAKTIGLELVQHVPATSQNITVDYLTATYNSGDIDNAKNNLVFVVTIAFANVPVLDNTKTYGFRYQNTIVLAKYVKPARETKNGLIFELQNKIEATIDANTGALTNVTYVVDAAMGEHLDDSTFYEVASDLSVITKVQIAGVDVSISSAANTKAVENYVPHQTTKGLNRTLGRKEADEGTDRGLQIDLKNDNFVIGNRVFTGNIGRLQYKRLEEQGKAPLTFLSASMLNEFAQEINYNIIAAARALGVTNALNFEKRGTSFNTYFGPSTVTSKPIETMRGGTQLRNMDNLPVTGQFAAVPNLRLTMQYETIASIGTAICMLIKQGCYAIGNDSRYGDGDSVVVSSNIAGYISASSLFTALNAVGTVVMDSRTGAKLSGTIGDIKVYVDLQIDEASPFVTVLRSNKEVAIDIPGFEEENIVIPGLAYLVKDIISSVEIIPEQTGGRKIIMDSETDLVMVGDNPEKAYLTFAIDIEIPGLMMRTA